MQRRRLSPLQRSSLAFMKHIHIGLLWHSLSSDNLGVGALTESQLAIVTAAARRAGVQARFTVFGTSGSRGIGPVDAPMERGDRFSWKRLIVGRTRFWQQLRQCDLVLDIGEGDSFTDIYGTERFWFEPGTTGFPVFQTRYLKLGAYICYDRHFPEGWRALGLAGADYVVNPSATWKGLSRHLWNLEQPAAAVANGFFVGAINRVGVEAPWSIGEFYGASYVVDPRGQIIAQGPEDVDALVVADIDLEVARAARDTWRFDAHRRPETYGALTSAGRS